MRRGATSPRRRNTDELPDDGLWPWIGDVAGLLEDIDIVLRDFDIRSYAVEGDYEVDYRSEGPVAAIELDEPPGDALVARLERAANTYGAAIEVFVHPPSGKARVVFSVHPDAEHSPPAGREVVAALRVALSPDRYMDLSGTEEGEALRAVKKGRKGEVNPGTNPLYRTPARIDPVLEKALPLYTEIEWLSAGNVDEPRLRRIEKLERDLDAILSRSGRTADDLERYVDSQQLGLRHNPPNWVRDEAIWQRAKEAVLSRPSSGKYQDIFAVVTHVYKKMGGRVR